MYPIKFNNIYYDKIWGGRALEKFRNNLPEGNIGESWDVAHHRNGESIVENGKYSGKTFGEIIELLGSDLLGKEMALGEFPLLIKIITAKDKLSVQVHPNDEYARKNENDLGKTECWYILDAEEDSYLILGTKNCDRETFKKAIEEGKTEDYLNKIKVKKGDMYYVESGLVHAICEGVTIIEIQQSSDTTYRVYDYNRGREIHVDKALDVINFSLKGEKSIERVLESTENYIKTSLCTGEYFNVEKYDVKDYLIESSNKERFTILTCVEGKGIIKTKEEDVIMKMGDSILIPAALGEYKIEGKVTFLKSYDPRNLK